MFKFISLYNLILEELTDKQKRNVDKFTAKRNKTLTFGPLFSEERSYFPLKQTSLSIIEPPEEIVKILDNENYYCPDYRQGYVYKKSDKLKSKPVKLIKVLNKALDNNQSLDNNQEKFNQLKKEFDERLKTSRKETVECEICITHNPYDVAGMSTDRNWTSCMELDTGAFKETPLKQVQYGRNVCIFN